MIKKLRIFCWIGILVIVSLLGVLATGYGSSDKGGKGEEKKDAGKPVTIKLSSPATKEQPSGQVLQHFADRVKEASKGRLNVEVYYSHSLYKDRAAVEAMQSGALEMAGIGEANWSPFSNDLFMFQLPFIIKDGKQLRQILNGPIGSELAKRIEQKTGIKVLWFQYIGSERYLFTTNKMVKTPADLKGLKIRTTASPVEQEIIKTYGGSPVVVDWAETYSALQQGIVEGEFQMIPWIAPPNHHEVVKYATDLPVYFSFWMGIISGNFFKSLPTGLQQILVQEGKEASRYSAELEGKDNTDSRKFLESKGIKFYKCTPEDAQKWRELAPKVWEKFNDKVDKDIMRQVLALGKKQ